MRWILFLAFLFVAFTGKSQADSTIFNRITEGMSGFKPNFSTPPADQTTEKIKELRRLRGGFNIREAIEFKLQEDRKEKKMPEEQLEALATYLTSGKGAQDIDNAVSWIYREHFTLTEIKQLVRFYKTSAGKKLNDAFPLIMLKSLAVAETVKEAFNSNK